MIKMNKYHKLWPFLCIILLWLIFAGPYLFKGLVPIPSKYLVTFFPPWNSAYGMPVKNNAMPDIVTQIYPWKLLTIDNWKKGMLPLWNPYSFAGTPHAANYQSAAFSPINILFLIFPQIDAWSIMVLSQPLLAGFFMFLFLKSLKLGSIACLFGSISFMFSGFMVVWMAYATLGYALLWLPFCLYAINKYSENPRSFYGILLTLGLGFSFLSGHFQISLYVSIFVFIYIVFKLKAKKKSISPKIFMFYFIGLVLALPQLQLSFESYLNSKRSMTFQKGEIIPWQYLITFISPDFYGNPVTRNDWFGHYAEWAGFIGVTPIMIALYSLTKGKSKVEWFFILSAICALLFAFPTPFMDFIYLVKFPVLSTSAASRIISIFSFSLSVVAALGFDKLTVKSTEQINYKTTIWFLGIIGFIVLIWSFLIWGLYLPSEALIIAKRNFILPSILALFTLLLVFVLHKATGRNIYWILLLLLFATAFDLLRFSTKWMPFDPKEYVYPKMSAIGYLESKVGISRVYGNFGNELTGTYKIPAIEGYDALYQSRYGELISSVANGKTAALSRSVVLVDKAGKYTEQLLQLLGVRYVLHRKSDGRNVWAYPFWQYDHYVIAYQDEYYEVYENTKAYPRVFLTSSYQVINDPQAILDTLWSEQFDRQNKVILETMPELEPAVGSAEAKIISYEPTKIQIAVKADSAKLLFLSDVYDKGWTAKIENRKIPIYRADYAFRAVAVPAGDYVLNLTYFPDYLIWSLVAVFTVIFYTIYVIFKFIFYENRHL